MADPGPSRVMVLQAPDGTFVEAQGSAAGHALTVPSGGGAGTSKSAPKTVTVTTGATSIQVLNANRNSIAIANEGSVTVFVGVDSSVTTANGFPIPAGGSLSDDQSTDAWFGIVASGTADVRVIEVA